MPCACFIVDSPYKLKRMSFQSRFNIISLILLGGLIFLLPVLRTPMAAQTVNSAHDQNKTHAWVWVSKNNGSIQCEKDSGTSLEEMEKKLQTARIAIHEKKKAYDSKMRAQVCGIETGQQNAFLIQKNDLRKAQKLGFAIQP